MKVWIVETRVTSRRVYHVQADDEKEAIFASTLLPPEVDEDEFEETISVTENLAVGHPPTDTQAAAASAPAQAEALPAGVDIGELGRDDLKRRAAKLLSRNGWKPGDQFSAHSTTELMVALAIDAVKNPPDRCAWPECGCCHDASCNEAALSSAPAQEGRADGL